jgi:general secretion pathway protein A
LPTTANASPATQRATATLAELLADPSVDTGTDAAFTQLFAAWGAALSGAQPPCEQARRLGLKCAFQVGSLRLLRTLNRPAILSLIDGNGNAHNAVVTQVGADSMTLRFGAREERVATSEMSAYWFGEFLLLWRPDHGDEELLLPGTRGSAIAWLRRALSEVQSVPLDSVDPGYYDAALRRQVQVFQRSRRLEADGKAGVQTMIAINSARALPNTPYLELP